MPEWDILPGEHPPLRAPATPEAVLDALDAVHAVHATAGAAQNATRTSPTGDPPR